MTFSPVESNERYCGNMGYQGRCYEPCGPCITEVRAVSIYSVQSQPHFSGCWPPQGCPCHWFGLWFLKTGYQGPARERRLFSLGTPELRLCFMQMMRVSTSKSEAMILCQKTVNCCLQVGSKLLAQAKEFKYLRALFTSEGKMECENRRFGAASTVMRALLPAFMLS